MNSNKLSPEALAKLELEAAATLDLIVGPVTEADLALSMFTPISEMPETKLWFTIRKAYQSAALHVRIFAVIMNGVATCRKHTFLLSRTWLLKYMELDTTNFGTAPKSMSGLDQSALMDTFLSKLNKDQMFLKELIAPSKNGKRDARSGLYTINNKAFIEMLPWWDASKIEAELDAQKRRLSGFPPGSIPVPSYKDSIGQDKDSVSVRIGQDKDSQISKLNVSSQAIPESFFQISESNESDKK